MLWCQNKNNAISAISLNFINKHINNFFQFVPILTFVVIILSSGQKISHLALNNNLSLNHSR
jgi:hypothetical protein